MEPPAEIPSWSPGGSTAGSDPVTRSLQHGVRTAYGDGLEEAERPGQLLQAEKGVGTGNMGLLCTWLREEGQWWTCGVLRVGALASRLLSW